MNFLFIGGGAALGAICRYDLTKVIKQHLNRSFPWATLCVNLLGTILLGIVAGLLVSTSKAYLFAGIGFCGGFTTFGTLNMELSQLWFQRRFVRCFLYFSLTYIFGILGFVIGIHV